MFGRKKNKRVDECEEEAVAQSIRDDLARRADQAMHAEINREYPQTPSYNDIASMVDYAMEAMLAAERRRVDENMNAWKQTLDTQREMWQDANFHMRHEMDMTAGDLAALRQELQRLLNPPPIVRQVVERLDTYEVIEALTKRQVARFTGMDPHDARTYAQHWADKYHNSTAVEAPEQETDK